MKIVYSTESIDRNGGIQTVTIVKANYLAEIEGNEVYIVVPHMFGTATRKISDKVHVINLGIKDYWVPIYKQPGRDRLYKKLLQEVFEKISPDIVISTGLQDRNFLPTIKVSSNPVFIREIHLTSMYRRMTAEGFKEKVLARISEFIDYKLSINRYDRIILLKEEDRKRHWAKNPKVTCIMNPLTITSTERSKLTAKRAIAVGRLNREKHFDALIKAWRIVADKYPDWTLDIWGGNGPLHDVLQKLISDLNLSDTVFLRGETPNISAKMADSSISICTSVIEGGPLVILEAMAAGLPIVTFNFMYGANEIVTEGSDGFIVEEDDLNALAERIGRLISDKDLRIRMGECAYQASKRFLPEVIIERWMDLFKSLRSEKPDPRHN